jgi:magnesium-transporting ATPase (P-type)
VARSVQPTPQSTVRRDGTVQRIPTTKLVAGDVLQVAKGDNVGADVRPRRCPDR